MQKRTVFLSALLSLVVILLGASWVQRDLMYTLIAGLQNLSSCGSCLALLVPLKGLAKLGDDAFTEALVDICSGMGVRAATPRSVCI